MERRTPRASHRFEARGNHRDIESFQNFLGGAKWISQPSTVGPPKRPVPPHTPPHTHTHTHAFGGGGGCLGLGPPTGGQIWVLTRTSLGFVRFPEIYNPNRKTLKIDVSITMVSPLLVHISREMKTLRFAILSGFRVSY